MISSRERARQVALIAEKSRRAPKADLVLENDGTREFFRFSAGLLVEYELTNYMGYPVALSKEEKEAADGFRRGGFGGAEVDEEEVRARHERSLEHPRRGVSSNGHGAHLVQITSAPQPLKSVNSGGAAVARYTSMRFAIAR